MVADGLGLSGSSKEISQHKQVIEIERTKYASKRGRTSDPGAKAKMYQKRAEVQSKTHNLEELRNTVSELDYSLRRGRDGRGDRAT